MEKLVYINQYGSPREVKPILFHCRAYPLGRKIDKFSCNKNPSMISLGFIPLSESTTDHKF